MSLIFGQLQRWWLYDANDSESKKFRPTPLALTLQRRAEAYLPATEAKSSTGAKSSLVHYTDTEMTG